MARRNHQKSDVAWRFVTEPRPHGLASCDPGHSSGLLRDFWLGFDFSIDGGKAAIQQQELDSELVVGSLHPWASGSRSKCHGAPFFAPFPAFSQQQQQKNKTGRSLRVPKNAQLPTTVKHHRRVARLGLAMDNLESEWNFSEATLALAKTSGYFALRVCAVDLKNAPQTAEALDKIKQCLAASQIEVEVENIKVKPLRAGSTSTLQDVFIVARLLPKASKMIQLLCNGPAGAYRQLFDLKEIGGIPSKGAYDPRSKLAKLPFNGAKFATMALVRSVMCVTETHGAERAAFMMDQVLIPALTARLDAEADEKRRILAGHEAKSLDATADLVTRQRANDAMVSQAPYLASLADVRSKLPDCFQILMVEPLMKHAHDALDSTLAYATRDYNDQSVMKMRGQVCNGFRSGGSLMYIVKRTHFNPFEARVISFLSSQLLSMKLPEQFLKLSPVFVLSVPKLTAATSDPDSIAGKFATVELVKTKVHLLAGESILNIDGENRHFGYDQLAVANITTESTDIYSVAHPFGGDEAAKHLWIRGFHEAAALEGQAVSVEYTSEEFFIREIDTVEVGAASSVWDIDNCLCTANEYVKHTNLKVEPGLLQTTPRHNDRSGPTPASLTKLVEIHNLMPAIKQWSKLNAPNEVWAAAAASVGVDVDADSGSGRGGGAIEERFKALEDANADLRKELGGVKSTVHELVTTVKDIGTNVNQGFAQIMHAECSSSGSTPLTHPRLGLEHCDDWSRGGGPAGNDLRNAGTDGGGSHGIRWCWRNDCECSCSRRNEQCTHGFGDGF